MKLVLLVTGLSVLAAYPLQGALAQDLFLKKGSGGTSSAETADKKAPAPLFLEGGTKGAKSSADSARPLFLDQPGGRSSSGALYRPSAKNAKIFDLQKKNFHNLRASETLGSALDKTRLANLAVIQEESARLQADTAQALARSQAEWEARQQMAAAQEADRPASAAEGQNRVNDAAPLPAEDKKRSAVNPGSRTTAPRVKEDDSGLPRPVFNTRH